MLVVASVGVLAVTGRATAHPGVGTRFDAPVPLGALLVGAGLVVAGTAGYLARGRTIPTGERRLFRLPAGVGRRLAVLGRAGFFLVFVAVLVDGVAGRQGQFENLATVLVWPLWLKGVALVSVLAGSPWRVLSPWHTLYRGLCRLEGRRLARRSYPGWLGTWPALVGVLGLGFLENLTVVPRDPLATAGVVAGYALLMVAGGVLFGPAWFERADALAVLYRLLGRTRVLDVRRAGADEASSGGYVVSARPAWRGCLGPVGPAAVGVVLASVYTVSFDGFRETPEFATVTGLSRGMFGPGLGAALPVYLLGLGGFVAAFGLAVWATAALGGGEPGPLARRLAPTVLPIAAAYEVAHNVDYLLVSAGALTELGGARLGLPTVDPVAWLSLPVYWGGQVLLVVGGHLVAVVAVHAVLARRDAAHTHHPVTAVMVGYTLVSLWTLSRPVVA
jgi:hypothetical protein